MEQRNQISGVTWFIYLFCKKIKSFWGNWNLLAEVHLGHSFGIILPVDVINLYMMTLNTFYLFLARQMAGQGSWLRDFHSWVIL